MPSPLPFLEVPAQGSAEEAVQMTMMTLGDGHGEAC